MREKIILLSSSLLGSILAFSIFYTKQVDVCDLYCGKMFGEYQNVFLFFPFILLFSLITLCAREDIFLLWWKFSKIAIPLVLVLSFIINLGLHHKTGGLFNTSDVLDVPILSIMYIAYTVGSLIAIYRGYRQCKVGGKGVGAAVDARRVI